MSREQSVAYGQLATQAEADGTLDTEEFHARAREILGVPEPGTAPARVPYTRAGRPV
ncbi:hypothetical protein GCM10022252_75530 [Streptosporangium oxazolinicum]|uniref:Antitoxin VbhA domain-containing protein n=1 Tax=Streptosporangium oxazolinicum TaxID=909287 RepID=A0ABP8BLY2_9ACTN